MRLPRQLIISSVVIFVLGVAGGVFYEKVSSGVFPSISALFLKDEDEDTSTNRGTAKIASIKAYLYYDNLGSISDNLIGNKSAILWNTIIGEGYAGKPSNSTLVVVEIAGKDVAPLRRAKANIVVRDSDGVVLINQTRRFSIYGNSTKYLIPLIVPNTGCSHITILAGLIGRDLNQSTISETIPYECGE